MARREFLREEHYAPPVEDDGPGLFGWLLWLIVGLAIGVGGTAYLMARPDTLAGIVAEAQRQAQALSQDQQFWAMGAAVVLGIVLVVILRRTLLRSGLVIGLVLGALAWAPFGRHMLALVPQAEAQLPGLSAGLERTIAAYPVLAGLRDMGEGLVPVPDTQTAAAPGGAGTAPADGAAGETETAPQAGDGAAQETGDTEG